KEPEDRFQTADEMRAALEAALKAHGEATGAMSTLKYKADKTLETGSPFVDPGAAPEDALLSPAEVLRGDHPTGRVKLRVEDVLQAQALSPKAGAPSEAYPTIPDGPPLPLPARQAKVRDPRDLLLAGAAAAIVILLVLVFLLWRRG